MGKTLCEFCGRVKGDLENPCCICGYMIEKEGSHLAADQILNNLPFNVAGLAAANQNYDQAIELYNECILFDKNWFLLYYLKGMCMFRSYNVRRHPTISLKIIKHALELAPEKPALRKRMKAEFLELSYQYMTELHTEFFFSFQSAKHKWSKIRVMIEYLTDQWLLNLDDIAMLKAQLKDLGGIKADLKRYGLDKNTKNDIDEIINEISALRTKLYVNFN